MNLPLFWKTLRDVRWLLVFVPLGILLFDVAAIRVLIEAARDLEFLRNWLERPLVQFLVRAALGADFAGELTPTVLITFAFIHPLFFALLYTLLLAMTSGVLAGEVGRGTADLLLTLPLSRSSVYVTTSLAWALVAAGAALLPMGGLWLGEQIFQPANRLEYHRLWPVALNLLALTLGVGGVATAISGAVSRRGVAIGIVLAGLLLSDIVHFVAQFWAAVRPLAVLGVIHYYRPLPAVRAATPPWGDMAVLLGVGLAVWLAGWWHFSRRDIPAT